ncbi:MAG: hypothetical protein KBC22_00395 [Candidatus Pacebacteria bacterium]|nr:hypothetical protein [Candidatus Paceibacterota bacterium]
MVTKNASKRIVLLDAHAIIHRAYHALPGFSSANGEATGALYGLVTMLLGIVNNFKPDYIIACYDLPGKTFRHEAYDDYKAGRGKTEDELIAQLKRSRDLCEAFNIPIYDAPGFEADDMLGTIVYQLRDQTDIEIIIASGDMDTLQLVAGDQVRVYTLRKGIKDTIIYNEDAVRERYGFGPKLMIDYKGLRGDPSDNIPGIPGIGEKSATTLISTFGCIEDIYKALEKSPEKFEQAGIKKGILQKLQDGREEAEFSKTLATIRHDAPINFVLPDQEWSQGFDQQKAQELFLQLDFRSLIHRLGEIGSESGEDTPQVEAESSEAEPDMDEVHNLGIGLWLINSEITHPKLIDIYQHTATKKFSDAKQKILDELKEKQLMDVYQHIELPLVPIIHQMHERGILLDIKHLSRLSEKYHTILSKLEKEIYAHAGVEFNIKSPKQLGEVLFDTMGLTAKGLKKTTGGARSTRESELQKLKDVHPIIEAILSYRNFQKILSTYVDNIPLMADEQGRLHADFVQTGTTTGRFSSQNPNLQNIPASDEFRKDVRNGFIASEGFTLVACDYSQIELRVAAILSGEPNFIRVFKDGGDIHTAVAARVFNVDESAITPDMRRQAKVINFGIIYGMGVNALRENLGSDRASAQEFYNTYFERFPGLRDYLDSVKMNALKKGYTETLFGRRRYFPALKSKLPFIRAQAERMAINAPIQGTATADIIKLALIYVSARLEKESLGDKVFPLLQVHDELVFEIADDVLEQAQNIIREEMEYILQNSFLHYESPAPLVVDINTAKAWGEMKK